MITMRAPEGLTGFTHQGFPVEIRDGVARVDPRFRPDFEAHGFLAEDEAGPAPAPARPLDLRKQVLIGLFSDRLDAMTDDELDAMLAEARAAQQREQDGASNLDPAAVTPEAIDAMTRPELFAFLKLKGVPAVPPITNEVLREKARAALSG
ncbi:hypothetical protein DA075_07845 [Methylobacterium currus]|uniref:Uncharacterized protein n=1 Tax=Methylobacterium currus TaxID=2051553 RepID=A0A2R4WH20_9HYPH|nr:hypothetical protein [Methylobacterium currus]AWB20835.1 hypothetical protein DA075_07845 [Methylobacterium currus]